MPLDSHPEDTLTSPRRHSLPPFLSDPLFRLYTSMTSTSEELPANFQRQMSLVDGSRRRFSAVQELRRQNAELLANLKLSQKRRVFAGKKIVHSESAILEVLAHYSSSFEVHVIIHFIFSSLSKHNLFYWFIQWNSWIDIRHSSSKSDFPSWYLHWNGSRSGQDNQHQ